MPLYRASLRALGAVALLATALACGGSKGGATTAATTIAVSGTVTYTRVPLATDTNGVPTGLVDSTVATNLTTLPAKGVMVRVYQRYDQVNSDGTTQSSWLVLPGGSTFTDANGNYAVSVPKDKPLMVELLSTFDGGEGHSINLVGDPAGINSTLPQAVRYRYAMRKAVDGTTPAGNPTPAAIPTGNSVVNFAIGLTDAWWLVNSSYVFGSSVALDAANPIDETTLPGRTVGTGSRILAIGDTIANFKNIYGLATPGATLDLHYAPGVSEPRGSFVEYDRSVYPLAYDDHLANLHYFGSLQGGPTNDDAWDEGVILPLIARNALFNGNTGRTYSIPRAPLLPVAAALTDLSPDMARIEGLAEAMAANILKSPYLADTQGSTLAAPVVDIRDISSLTSAQLTPYSAPALRALAWEIILKANSVASPGTPTTWSTLNALTAARFFISPARTSADSTQGAEPLNIYSQLSRLKEGKVAIEPVDLATLFTDSALTSLTAPYGVPWPRPTTGSYASFAVGWGTDPNALTTPLAPFTLSMAKAVQVRGTYPNLSEDEVFYSGFSLSADKRYVIGVTISPALAAGGELDLDLPYLDQTYTFTGAGGSTQAIVFAASITPPVYYPVRARLKSPDALQPDVAVTVSFTPSL
ncbi:hypothetical protein [Geothrix fuzhouensis]|uniref:hypothetical protein n=1 Tax=Geothrix fuzhouensis TaxID=2966451 RepID=UPI002147A3C3|nr:hypothetical protein [Geothrix fuzhouensis]